MKIFVSALIVLAAGSAMAQQHQHRHTPYAGSQQRSVKALSDQQISELQSGRGMGLALAAELNGYPGPLHVLELADQLQLTDDQRQHVQHLYDSMKAEAILVGQKVIEQETALDRQFAERKMTATILASLTADIGATPGQTSRSASEVSSDDRRVADDDPGSSIR